MKRTTDRNQEKATYAAKLKTQNMGMNFDSEENLAQEKCLCIEAMHEAARRDTSTKK